MTVRVAAIQFSPAYGRIDDNLERLTSLMTEAAEADLIVAPELATTGYDIDRLGREAAALAEPIPGPATDRLGAVAAGIGATLVVGVLEADDKGTIYDSVAILSGRDPVVYRKTHLYPPEIGPFTPGDRLVTAAASGGVTVGAMICFEHAFPEIATTLALNGAEVLAIPSAVPFGFEHLLDLRTRARAQDNQVFAIASNLTGAGFCGRSLIVDPRGDILSVAGEAEAVITATIDIERIAKEREREPALRLRRPELYH